MAPLLTLVEWKSITVISGELSVMIDLATRRQL